VSWDEWLFTRVARGATWKRLTQNRVLFLHIKFEISTKEIRGYVALLMDIPSVDELRLLIADFICQRNETQPILVNAIRQSANRTVRRRETPRTFPSLPSFRSSLNGARAKRICGSARQRCARRPKSRKIIIPRRMPLVGRLSSRWDNQPPHVKVLRTPHRLVIIAPRPRRR
jgi:hypothetical protein